jgi:hypothetical protein
MALGGGSFISQNKVLPGAYINFVSAASASATLSDRGVVTMPLELDWGAEGEIFEVTVGDFQKNSTKYFGYPYTHEKMKGLRDLFRYAKTLYAYKLNSGGEKAACTFATAKYPGVRGNALKIVIQANVDDSSMFDCYTYMDNVAVDLQTVSAAANLVDNDYVTFKKDANLLVTASTPLTGGSTGTVPGQAYQGYFDKIESYRFNTMGIVSTENVVKGLAASFVKRMRDDVGVKFQLVLYDYKSADYMGVISVKNEAIGSTSKADLVYWVTGAQAGCAVNKSLQNKQYDGEYTMNVDFNQSELVKAIQAGEFTFHNVNGIPRVLDDINTKVSVSDTEGNVFKDNQTVRVIDQIGNDIAVLFANKYLGAVPNDATGRVSLWSDIVKHHKDLQSIRAIEDFEDSDVVISPGDTKKAVAVQDAVTVVNAMSKLYMTTVIS